MWYDSFLVWEGIDFILDFMNMFNFGIGSVLGWGNMNDLIIYLVLFFVSVIYYLYKYFIKLFFWLYLVFFVFWIYVFNVRGFMVIVLVFGVGMVIYVVFKCNKR